MSPRARRSLGTDARRVHRNGYKPRSLKTRVWTIELRVPQDREGTFKPDVFDRYQRSEKAWVVGLMETYLAGISTRKVTDVTEALCGTSFSKSTVSSLAGVRGHLYRWADSRDRCNTLA